MSAPRSEPETDLRDEAWFEALVADHHRAVLAYARRRDVGDPEDLLAQVLAVTWRKRHQVPDEPLPWLYAVAAREVQHARRARARRVSLVQRIGGFAHGEDRTADVDDALSAAATIRDGLSQLAQADAEILRLWAWEELNSHDIAQVLGISAGAARVRLHRAQKRLRAVIDQPTLEPQE